MCAFVGDTNTVVHLILSDGHVTFVQSSASSVRFYAKKDNEVNHSYDFYTCQYARCVALIYESKSLDSMRIYVYLFIATDRRNRTHILATSMFDNQEIFYRHYKCLCMYSNVC